MSKEEIVQEKPIAFFDSGAGGLTVLALAARMLPAENFLYFGDTANAPYGSKDKEEVRALSLQAAELLVEKGCKALVVACNTATSAAVDLLREKFTLPVIGMEPAIKPALAEGGKVLVMATPLTLREKKFRQLYNRYATATDEVTLLPCPGLVELIEQGIISGPALENVLTKLFSEVNTKEITTVVLGCTHYLFIKATLQKMLPGVKFIDGNLGTVRQLQRVLTAKKLSRSGHKSGGQVEILASGGEASLDLLKKLYAIASAQWEGEV
ncbi:MAG: glutamate racemase [Firmicutes bacterium]|nr:glutamate racemase [Bacillota bacterium]